MKQRIQKILAHAGLASRRNIEEMVRQGRVAVNGKVLTELPILVDPQTDRVSVDGENLKLRSDKDDRRVYILMNKPKGIYSTNVAQGDQVRAIDLLPPEFSERLYPVGRLDAESKGLLLLTNDGDLTNRLTHPRFGVPKTYRAGVDGWIGPKEIEALQKGIWLSDQHSGKGFKASVGHVTVVRRGRERSILDITLREGRNRQVRRMLASIGHKVRELTRIKMGPLVLGNLQPGHFRELSGSELKKLHEYLERGKEKAKSTTAAAKDPKHRGATRR
ncbi:MAG TPA: pseudouridine synthase [Tepidisphaeraceae bacterium]|jgi:23S rRNA pseudouridine2605 synthase